MLNDEKYVELILTQNLSTNIEMSRCSVIFQTTVMEKMFQIEKGFGCKYMSSIQEVFALDEPMLNAAKAFTYATIKCYVRLLRLRRQRSGTTLRRTGGMTKTMFLEFFEACNALSKYFSNINVDTYECHVSFRRLCFF